MNIDLINIIVTSLVFVFLLSIFIQYLIDLWYKLPERNILYKFKEGFEDMLNGTDPEKTIDSKKTTDPENTADSKNTADPEKNTNSKKEENEVSLDISGGTTPTTTPSTSMTPIPSTLTPEPDYLNVDYATMNSTNITELFDKVNTQTDIIRTLKQPYSDKFQTVKFDGSIGNADVDINTVIFSNLIAILRSAIQTNDNDLKSNPGIIEIFQYSGNESIGELINELGLMTADNIKKKHDGVSTVSCTVTDAAEKVACVSKIYKQFDRKMESDYINRVMAIVDAHQRIIDRILEKKSKG